jgi:His/Glu/Gln/Arg/opine family amino acid ABC transporter permease subunit
MSYDWNFAVALIGLPLLLEGLWISVQLAAITMITGSLLGLAVALMRIDGPRAAGMLCAAYVQFFRNTPLLAQLCGIYYAAPVLTGLRLTAFEAALLAFTLNVGAVMGEIVRAGIRSVARGQWEAAAAIGLDRSQTYMRIVLPQALINVLPTIATVWLSLLKDTSVASVISVYEMMYEARRLAVDTYRPVEIFTICGLVYFIVVYAQSVPLERLYARWLRDRRRSVEEAAQWFRPPGF